jgi:DNA-binding HxlR family transcriptional regulator
VIGGKWKSLIIYHLNEGDQRNGQLRRASGDHPENTHPAAARDRAGWACGAEIFPVVPPRLDYRLTDLGMSVLPVVGAMVSWGEANADAFPAVLEVAAGAN